MWHHRGNKFHAREGGHTGEYSMRKHNSQLWSAKCRLYHVKRCARTRAPKFSLQARGSIAWPIWRANGKVARNDRKCRYLIPRDASRARCTLIEVPIIVKDRRITKANSGTSVAVPLRRVLLSPTCSGLWRKELRSPMKAAGNYDVKKDAIRASARASHSRLHARFRQ